jgi:hypothetical protein
VKLSASRRPWERLVWRATGQNLALYVGGSIGRRQLLDAWLQANGLPAGGPGARPPTPPKRTPA